MEVLQKHGFKKDTEVSTDKRLAHFPGCKWKVEQIKEVLNAGLKDALESYLRERYQLVQPEQVKDYIESLHYEIELSVIYHEKYYINSRYTTDTPMNFKKTIISSSLNLPVKRSRMKKLITRKLFLGLMVIIIV